jgi:hypothetical protein
MHSLFLVYWEHSFAIVTTWEVTVSRTESWVHGAQSLGKETKMTVFFQWMLCGEKPSRVRRETKDVLGSRTGMVVRWPKCFICRTVTLILNYF